MRVDYRTASRTPGRLPTGKVYREAGGVWEKIPSCFYFDTETGEYGEHVLDSEGALQRDPDRPYHALERWGRAPLRFEPSGRHIPSREEEEAFVAELRAAAWPGWFKRLGHKLGVRRWCPACRRMTWWHWAGYCPAEAANRE